MASSRRSLTTVHNLATSPFVLWPQPTALFLPQPSSLMQPVALAWLPRFLSQLSHESRLSPHTEAAYRRDLSEFIAYCDRQNVSDWVAIDNFHVRSFAAAEHRRGLSPRSIQRRLAALRSFFTFLAREGVSLKANPANDIS